MKASVMDGGPSGGEDSASQASDEQLVTLQIYVPELVVQKCMQFNREEIIWDVKNQILAALPKELKEGFNYGLFCPPVNGRAGRFLDEERPLMDYPFTESNTYVELRYKRRIYKMSMEEKQLKQLHSRANLRRLLDHVHNSHVEKITKMCLRGLDPNFHCQETGESPLTLATGLKHPAKVIMALVNGGAHLDFRTKDGCTVLHKAVEKNNLEALRTLLDLGSSPNYKDSRGLTTLYYSVLYNSDPQLTEMLLHDHALIGTADPHGWQEVHQACKYGLVQHLEHLLFYGADMNARNASGNTPLHVCAVNDQESCARVLLFRGADKNALNYANQNPHQVAVIAGNLRLADIIKNHKPEDVDVSDSTGVGANGSGTDSDPFDSAKSTPLLESVCVCIEEYNPSTSGHLQLAKGDLLEVLAVSGSGYLEGRRRDGEEGLFPASCIQEMVVKCADTLPPARYRTEGRRSTSARGSLDMPRKWKMFGDPRTVVLHKGKKGFGFILRGAKATSPLMGRQPTEFWPSLQYLDDVDKGGVAEMAGLRKGDFLLEINGQDVSQASHEHVVAVIRQSGDLVSMTVVTVLHQPIAIQPSEKPQLINRQCATLPRKLSTKKAPLPPKRDPKTALSVGRARARSMVAGLAEIEVLDHTLNEYDSEGRSTKSSSIESIPNKPSAGATPDSTPCATTTNPLAATTATTITAATSRARPSSRQISITELEDFFARHFNSADHLHCGSLRNKCATMARIHKMKRSKKPSFSHAIKDDMDFRIPKNYSSTPELTLEVSGFEELLFEPMKSRRSRSVGDVHFAHSRHCARRNYSKSSHSKEQQKKERILQRQHSIPETSRNIHSEKQKLRERSSTPEIQGPSVIKHNGSDIYAETVPVQVKGSDKNALTRASCPPPSYPPPPPPVGQMIKVDVSRGEYANATLGHQPKSNAVMSSFRPTDSAKLYASPDAITAVGYKIEHFQMCDVTLPRHLTKGANLRSHSLPPKMPQSAKSGNEAGGRSTASLDTDYSSGDSTTGYEPSFKTVHRSREQTGTETSYPTDKRGTLRKVKNSSAKLPLGVSESSSPKNHDHFIQEPDYESSEEDTTSAIESKGGLVTFRAMDNQGNSTDKPKSSSDSPKASDNERSSLERKSSVKSGELPEDTKKTENPTNKNRRPGGEDSEVVLSEETGERIFVKSDKLQKSNSNASESLDDKDGGNGRTKSQKVPPVPPPKRTDTKQELLNEKENTLLIEHNNNNNAKHLDDVKPGPESAVKSALQKESVPFKATIILKQTEVIHKEPKEIAIKSKTKELIHQHSAHELIHSLESSLKGKVEENSKEEIKNIAQKVKSPPQTLQKPTKTTERSETAPKPIPDSVTNDKNDAMFSQKVAPAVPKKPKVEDIKNIESSTETSPQDVRKSLQIDDQVDDISPNVDMASKSVRENIYNFEKQSQQAAVKSNFSPRRKSDVIRITLVGSQHKAADVTPDGAGYVVQTMKTSKSCPKTFEEEVDIDEGPSLTAILASEVESQVTRFSAETPTTSGATKDFSEEWRRPGVVSPITLPTHIDSASSKKAPETPPKAATSGKKTENSTKENTLCRRASSNNIELENGDTEMALNGSSTINRLGFIKTGGNIHSMTHVSQELDAILATTTIAPKSSGLFTHPNASQTVGTPTSRQPALLFQNTPQAAGTPTPRQPPNNMTNNMMQATMRSNTTQQPCIQQHSSHAGIPAHSVPSGMLIHTVSSGMPPTSMHSIHTDLPGHMMQAGALQQPSVPPHAVQPGVVSHAMQPNVPPHSAQSAPGIPPHLVQPGIPYHSVQATIPSHTPRVTGTPMTATAHAQSPAVPPHAYNVSSASAHIAENRRMDEQLVNCIKTRDLQDHPYYVVSPSQPPKAGPMSAQARLLDNRHFRAPPPSSKVPPVQKSRDDDVCLRLCEQVDKSLQLIRLQVDCLGMAAANEPESLTELVPPPPEFNFTPGQGHHPGHALPHHGGQQPLHIAPPPEFSDESLARQRRGQQQLQQGMIPAVPQHRMMAPPLSTMDTPISRRTVPPDMARYPYPEHAYRGHIQPSPQDPRHMPMHHPHQQPQHHPHQQPPQHHHQQQHSMPNNVTSSPVKTMTMSRSGYPTHNLSQQQIRYESNCNTLPHPGARMVMMPPQTHPQQQLQRMDHGFTQGGRSVRDDPQMLGSIPPPPQPQKEFRQKPLPQWNMRDVSDWLESLFLPEYKICFAEAGITGSRLANMDNNDLMGLGVKQAGHRMNMERSIKWYLK